MIPSLIDALSYCLFQGWAKGVTLSSQNVVIREIMLTQKQLEDALVEPKTIIDLNKILLRNLITVIPLSMVTNSCDARQPFLRR